MKRVLILISYLAIGLTLSACADPASSQPEPEELTRLEREFQKCTELGGVFKYSNDGPWSDTKISCTIHPLEETTE